MVVCLMMTVAVLGAHLGGQGQGHLLAVGVAQNDGGLVDGDGGVLEGGQVDASLLGNVLADDLVDLDLLGHAHLLGLGHGHVDGHLQRDVDQRHAVLLGLVLLAAVLMFSLIVMPVAVAVGLMAVAGCSAGGDLHGLGLVLVGDLGGGGAAGLLLRGVSVSANFAVVDGGDLFALGPGGRVAELVVHDVLDGQLDGARLRLERGHADLGVDGGVGVAAVELGLLVAVAWVGVGVIGFGLCQRQGRQEGEQEQGLHMRTHSLTL